MLLNFFGHQIGIFIIKGVNEMAVIYAQLIIKGKRTYDSIPKTVKAKVAEILIDMEMEELITE